MYHFADSWFEDDAELDKVVAAVLKKKRNNHDVEFLAVSAVIDKILEKRRQIWLERLTLNALWLKAAKKTPLHWHQMFYLAETVADTTFPLAEIPLMESIAIQSLGANLSRREYDAF